METLKTQIQELKNGRTLKVLKSEDIKTYYKVMSLTSKLSDLKAISEGKVLTKEHLTEYKKLVIWLMKVKCNFKGYLDVKKSCEALFEKITENQIPYKTERGIKRLICSLTINTTLDAVWENMVKKEGIDLSRENTLNNRLLSAFQDFSLTVKMNN